MTIKDFLNRACLEAQLSGKVKNKQEFAVMIGASPNGLSKALAGVEGFTTQSLENKVRAAFPEIAAQVDSMERPAEVHIGDINNQSPHHFTTGTDARVHSLETEVATLKAENRRLQDVIDGKDAQLAEKERLIQVYEKMAGR